jgi:predicted DNA-binding transcriptional regulator YafY
MSQQTSRTLTLLELLQSRPFLSGPELASRLEIDVRTVRRYVTTLQDMGIPIEATTGRAGGYRLRPGFKLPPLMFTNEEVLALTLGLLLARKVGVEAITPAVEGVMAKLERTLPVPLRQRIRALHGTLLVGMAKPETPVERLIVQTISLAAQQSSQVRLHYRAEDTRETERLIDPSMMAIGTPLAIAIYAPVFAFFVWIEFCAWSCKKVHSLHHLIFTISNTSLSHLPKHQKCGMLK